MKSIEEILEKISCEYKKILGVNLVGIYVHGSISFKCFNWDKSDIDFIVVINDELLQQQKVRLIQILLDLTPICPKKGLEMSILLKKYCSDFVYPTPFELHFSNGHIQQYRDNIVEYCKNMNGSDKDLAAHFSVIKSVGIVLYGLEINDVFGDVPKEAFIDSVKDDIKNAYEDVINNTEYIILNLCRVLAYIDDEILISKESGGLWGIKHLPKIYTPLIQTALDNYRYEQNLPFNIEIAKDFCRYMLNRIFN